MIKYKEITYDKNIHKAELNVSSLLLKYPIKYTNSLKEVHWCIPIYRLGINLDWVFHRSDGPAIEYANGDKWWYYYGVLANSEEEFYNLQWRRKIEIKEFLYF